MVDLESGKSGDRRAEILALATDAFLTHGYSGTSMADLAGAVGIRKASLYHHFPSKHDLFVACVSEGFLGALKRLEDIRDDPNLSDPDRIRAAMEEIYRVNTTTVVGRMAPLIAEVAPRIPEVARAFYDGFIARHYGLLTGMIEDGIARGCFLPVDAVALRQLIIGPVVFMQMEREITATFADGEALVPIRRIRESHISMVLQLLTGAAPAFGDVAKD
jgi:AcrR family transcriptional regulator